MKATFIPYHLKFKFDAGTSRGILKEKKTWFIALTHKDGKSRGIGECGPLKGLSTDDREDFEDYLKEVLSVLNNCQLPASEDECLDLVSDIVSDEFPSIRFGMEVALLDLINGGSKTIFANGFVKGEKVIPINGLIWMGEKDFMLTQIDKKLSEGYRCLKLKIGAIDFKKECELIEYIRGRFSAEELDLRVDANGAFSPEEALEKLKILNQYALHSIEQPIKPRQMDEMTKLIKAGFLPIALDEELIGVNTSSEKIDLLNTIRPPYIILKPTLLGGFKSTREWIRLAEEQHIGWWITSALESNIGLNAIAQFTANYHLQIPQGLGTGQLFTNNIHSPLEIEKGFLKYGKGKWGDFS